MNLTFDELLLTAFIACIIILLWTAAGWMLWRLAKKTYANIRTLPSRITTGEFWFNLVQGVLLVGFFAFLVWAAMFVIGLGLCIFTVGALCV